MASSGTVGQTSTPVVTIIEHAVRRAGLKPTDITADITYAAKNNLYFLLTSLSNSGVNLWAIDKQVIGLVENQYIYNAPAGTLEILNCLYRNLSVPSGTPASSAGGTAANAFSTVITAACTQTSASGNISFDFGSATAVQTVGLMANGNQTYSLVYEYSTDNVTWVAAYTAPALAAYADRQWVSTDIDLAIPARYFRVREAGNGILNVRGVQFAPIVNETPLGRVSLDSYTGMSSKLEPARQPLQFWYDRQISPRMNLWPVPNYSFDQIVLWRTRHLQDVGALTNTLEIPQRWVDAVTYELAMRLLLEIPGADMSRLPVLAKMADVAKNLADAEERDQSPVMLSPDISMYTQ